jgi:hypothetical protein
MMFPTFLPSARRQFLTRGLHVVESATPVGKMMTCRENLQLINYNFTDLALVFIMFSVFYVLQGRKAEVKEGKE